MTAAWAGGVATLLAAYEYGARRAGRNGRGVEPWRHRCWWAAAVLLLAAGTAPLAPLASRHLWAEALQFGLVAFGVAPLVALAAPARLVRAARARRTGPRLALIGLACYLAVTIGWRLPFAVDFVARGGPALALETVTLVTGSFPLWIALVGSPPLAPLASRPRRIMLAAPALWSVWIFAYVVGFSRAAFYPAYAARLPVFGQQLTVFVLWAASAAALMPVAFVSLSRWLGAEQAAAEREMEVHRARLKQLAGEWARPVAAEPRTSSRA